MNLYIYFGESPTTHKHTQQQFNSKHKIMLSMRNSGQIQLVLVLMLMSTGCVLMKIIT